MKAIYEGSEVILSDNRVNVDALRVNDENERVLNMKRLQDVLESSRICITKVS